MVWKRVPVTERVHRWLRGVVKTRVRFLLFAVMRWLARVNSSSLAEVVVPDHLFDDGPCKFKDRVVPRPNADCRSLFPRGSSFDSRAENVMWCRMTILLLLLLILLLIYCHPRTILLRSGNPAKNLPFDVFECVQDAHNIRG